MKYKLTPFNIISALIVLKIIYIMFGSVHENLDTWALEIVIILIILTIPATLIGIDYLIQQGLKGKKYILVFTIEMILILLTVLVLWFCFNIRTFEDLVEHIV